MRKDDTINVGCDEQYWGYRFSARTMMSLIINIGAHGQNGLFSSGLQNMAQLN